MGPTPKVHTSCFPDVPPAGLCGRSVRALRCGRHPRPSSPWAGGLLGGVRPFQRHGSPRAFERPLLGCPWWQEAAIRRASLLFSLVPQSPLTPFLCPCPDVHLGPSPVLMLLCVSCVLSQVFICLCLHASSLVCLSLSHSSKHHSLAVGWGWAGEQNVPPGRARGRLLSESFQSLEPCVLCPGLSGSSMGLPGLASAPPGSLDVFSSRAGQGPLGERGLVLQGPYWTLLLVPC